MLQIFEISTKKISIIFHTRSNDCILIADFLTCFKRSREYADVRDRGGCAEVPAAGGDQGQGEGEAGLQPRHARPQDEQPRDGGPRSVDSV